MMSHIFILFSLMLLSGCVQHQSQGVFRESEDNHEVIQSLPATARINTQLGMEYLKANDVERARSKLLTALRQAPEIPEVWYSMAYFMEKTGNIDGARTYYQKSVSIAPKRGDVLNNYGTFLCRNGFWSESINYFQKAMHDNNYLTPADAMENAGNCAMKIPNRTLAVAFFQKATEEDPLRKNAFISLSKIYLHLSMLEEAEENLSRFLALSAPTAESKYIAEKIHLQLRAKTG